MKPPVFESRAGRLCGGMLDASEATEGVSMPAMSDFVPIFDFTEANFADTPNTIKLFESSNHCSMPTEPSVRHETKNPEDLIRGQNRMAELVRAHDWSATPLGPIEVWSEALLSLRKSHAPGCHAKVGRTKAVLSQMPPLLLQLWREQHPRGQEQTALNFSGPCFYVA
jgi:hypothetical protein